MPVHSESRECKKCGLTFSQLIKKGRPYTKCAACRSAKNLKEHAGSI